MSVVPKLKPLTDGGPMVMQVTWLLSEREPEGAPVLMLQWVDRTVQAEGEFASGHVDGEVSNSGEDYVVGLIVAYPGLEPAPPGAYFRPRLVRGSPESRVRVTLTGRRP